MGLWRDSDLFSKCLAVVMVVLGVLDVWAAFAYGSTRTRVLNLGWGVLLFALAWWHLRIGRTRRRNKEIDSLYRSWLADEKDHDEPEP